MIKDPVEIENNKLREELKLLESESTREVLNKFNKIQDKRSSILQSKQIQEDITFKLDETKEFIKGKMAELYSMLDLLGISYNKLEEYFQK